MSEFEQANLISWARHLARRGKLQDLFDPALQSMDQDQALLCITVAFLYLQRSPVKRPSIKEVVGMLSGDSKPPHLPGFIQSSEVHIFGYARTKISDDELRNCIRGLFLLAYHLWGGGGGGGGGGSGWSSSSSSSASAVSSVSSSIYFELWHACAGPLTSLPKKGSVVYFPQGHIEQAVFSSSMSCLEMPIFGLQPQIFCRVVNVQLLANKKNDEVYFQVTLFLEPENNVAKLLEIALDDGMDKEPNVPLPSPEVSLLELLPVVPVEPGGVELDSHSSCNLQGVFTSTQLFLLLLSWFPFSLFDMDWIGREVYNRDPKGVLDEILAYDQVVREGTFGLLLNSVVLGISSFLIEPMCQRMGARLVWAMSNFIVLACMDGIAIISLLSVSEYSEGIQHVLGGSKSIRIASLVVLALLGFPLSITFSVPFSVTAELTSDTGGGQGLAIGVLNLAIVIPQACFLCVFILLIEEKLTKGRGGENAYHVAGYRYLLFDSNKNMSLASPPGKVATLAMESLLAPKKLREEVDLEKCRTKKDNPSHEKNLEVCIRANNNSWVIARVTRGKELYMVLEKESETLLYASNAVEKFSNRTYVPWELSWFPFFLFDTDWMGREVYHGDPKGVPDEILAYDSSPDQWNSANAIFCLWMAGGNILGFSAGSNGNWHRTLKADGKGNGLSLSKLKEYFVGKLEMVLQDGTSAESKKKGLPTIFVARVDMLHVHGSFIFPTKKGTDVSARYLCYFSGKM
ncbi:hypothetical protein GIB67_033846 [Kingdonia uniflora]|uniref:Uncharacterized protein n=1 Tax=Kingdonia uniflora TaxID=39325 RepID=A0A7J7LIP2_9MAGN|nr:hypothetical protein GIB67_033846 [Kingdonia uniflora]